MCASHGSAIYLNLLLQIIGNALRFFQRVWKQHSSNSKHLWAFPVSASTISQSVLTGGRGIISHMSTEICNTSPTIKFVSWKKSPLDSDRASSSSLRLIFCVLSFGVTEGKEAVEIVVGMTLLRFWSKWAGGNEQGLTAARWLNYSIWL